MSFNQTRSFPNGLRVCFRGLLVLFWMVLLRDQCFSQAGASDAPPVAVKLENDRPNIVWILVEDMSAHFSCYGESAISTPNVDWLASTGTRFDKAFVTAPICSISRSALITGRYQTSIGAQNHRSSVPGHPIILPPDVSLLPSLFRIAGYHTNNLTLEAFARSAEDIRSSQEVKVAKTDYNFEWIERSNYDSTHWASREAGKPFFVQIQLNGGKYRGQGNDPKWPLRVQRDLGSITSIESVHLPPYLPNDPVILNDWAQYLDTVRYTDWEVGKIIQRLREAGELDKTVIFFITDHGISHVRNKQFLYDGGTHIPMIVRGPGVDSGKLRSDLVEHIDLAATSLGLARIEKPLSIQSQDIFSSSYQARKYVFAARDRADETVDLIRSVRDERFKLIRNGFPNRPYLQPNRYKDNKPIVQAMRRLHADGKLTLDQSRIMADTRPRIEFYDTLKDPFELHNLAADPVHRDRLSVMDTALSDWQRATGDLAETESLEVYRLEVEAKHLEAGNHSENEQYKANVDLMLRWHHERPLVKTTDQ